MKNLIIGILLAALAITLYYAIQNNSNDKINNNSNEDVKNKVVNSVYSQEYNLLIKQTINTNSNSQKIELIDLKTNETHNLDIANTDIAYHSLLLGKDGSRLYFGKTKKESELTTLFYTDFDALDPYALTEIVVGDFGPLTGEFQIIGEKDNTIYIQKDNDVYSLEIDFNASPELISSITLEDTINKYSFKFPNNSIDSADNQIEDNITTAGELYQFSLSGYPFTGPDDSPYFEVKVLDNTGNIESINEYFNNQLSELYPENAIQKEETINKHNWLKVCTNENDSTACGAFTFLDDYSVLSFSYDVQSTTSAVAEFSIAFQETLNTFVIN